jgi:hypothetical protein
MEPIQRGDGHLELRASASVRRPGDAILVPLLASALLAALVACAPMQVVELRMQPAPVVLFVDGELREQAGSGEIRLRADRSHILHFERPGYRPQQVLVRSLEEAGELRLRPRRVSVRLQPIEHRHRQLEVELETVRENETK